MKISRIFALFLMILAVYWTYKSLMPTYTDKNLAETGFSTENALAYVEKIAEKPHAVGFESHQEVNSYIVEQLNAMGLQTTVQEGFVIGDWGNLCRAKNILAKIDGANKGKALLLLSHYDSSPHSSFGASDAGSGVATILEGVRAFLAENQKPKNDIIILISDGEELGLNGAELFVNEHPWAKNIGLVLNFEARGSGGPSYMLIETNRGNQKLIEEFVNANPDYPVANSLAYSIYKMLPNDTDLTVFREDGDIEGFNFAFIDDHFDYHTALDTHERLDKESLAHQGSYLMPLLHYFADADLDNLKSLNDNIYFNVPFFKLISYPFDWIWPMYLIAIVAFILILVHGFKKGQLESKELLKGFLPMLLILVITGICGYVFWPILTWWYPWFNDMLHGFTYSGHTYILVMALFSIAVCLLIYREYCRISLPNLLVAPIILWLIICGLVNVYLEGASFFVIPLFALLVGFYVSINQKEPNLYLLLFLSLPAVAIFTPFIKMFPVGLGLKMMVASTLFTSFIFFLSLPFFKAYISKRRLAAVLLLIFFIYNVKAHLNSNYSENRPKPSSLVYTFDADSGQSYWATYDQKLTEWNGQFIKSEENNQNDDKTISSKYGTRFRLKSDAPEKAIPLPEIQVEKDTVIGQNRHLRICVTPKRNINRLDAFTNEVQIEKVKVNNQELSEYYLENRRGGKLFTHFVSDNDFTEIELQLPNGQSLELTFYEASNDLLTNPLFTVPERPKDQIPMPFVLNDAIIVSKTIKFE